MLLRKFWENKTMKIGILTLSLETNYGGILQAFALQKVLRDMGHEVYTIDRHNRRAYKSFAANLSGFIKRNIQRYIQHKNVSVCWNPFLSDEEFRILSSNTRDFVTRNMNLTRECWSDELACIDDEYKFDAYVVGSDQVWLPAYYPTSFLSFVKRPNVIKVTYAASCGKVSFLDVKGAKEGVAKYAKEFAGISVREDVLVNQTAEFLGQTPVHVLDPTLLLSPDEYLKASLDKVGTEPIVFSYILDMNEEKLKLATLLSKELSLPLVEGNTTSAYVKANTADISKSIFPPVDNWIRNIQRAEFVITDSFHGTVFAILFNKPFISIGNKNRGIDRFLSLLRLFNLESRLITEISLSDIYRIMKEEIDYSKVNHRLEVLKGDSLMFLHNSLRQSDAPGKIV